MHASAASSGNKEGSGPEVEGSEPACAHDSPPCDQTLEAIQPAAASLLRGEGGRYVASAASNMFIEGEPRGDEELRPGDGERMSRGTGEPMRDIDTVVRGSATTTGCATFAMHAHSLRSFRTEGHHRRRHRRHHRGEKAATPRVLHATWRQKQPFWFGRGDSAAPTSP